MARPRLSPTGSTASYNDGEMPDRRRKPSVADFAPSIALEGRRVAVEYGKDARRIAVRIANFGETHSGFGPMVKVPRNVNVDAAHVGVADLSDGSSVRVATLPMHTTHAPTDLKAMHAASWYEHTGTAIARGRYSIDEHGVRFDGVLYDDVDESTVDRLTASSASGDWRSAVAIKRFADYEHTPCDFVGACVVNIPGFSDTFHQAAGERFALAASAHSILSIENEVPIVDEENETLTAGGDIPDVPNKLPDGCSGECTGCTCQTPPVEAPKETVTLTASAAKILLELASGGGASDATGADCEEVDAAINEAESALTASGFLAAPDPRDERLAQLERIVIDLAFNTQD